MVATRMALESTDGRWYCSLWGSREARGSLPQGLRRETERISFLKPCHCWVSLHNSTVFYPKTFVLSTWKGVIGPLPKPTSSSGKEWQDNSTSHPGEWCGFSEISYTNCWVLFWNKTEKQVMGSSSHVLGNVPVLKEPVDTMVMVDTLIQAWLQKANSPKCFVSHSSNILWIVQPPRSHWHPTVSSRRGALPQHSWPTEVGKLHLLPPPPLPCHMAPCLLCK